MSGVSTRTSNNHSKKLMVIIPAFNEEGSIHRTIVELRSISNDLAAKDIQISIIVIDDGSVDNTRKLAVEAGADFVVPHRVNMGLGAAVRTGIRVSRQEDCDILVKFDADLQHDPNDILALIEPILNDEADIVYGHRFNKIEYRMPLTRRMGNIVFTRLMRQLTGWPIRDSQPGIFAINREYLDVAMLPGDYNYTQQMLMNAYLNKMRFAQVDVSFRPRRTGSSFVSLRYPFKVLTQILLAVASVKPLAIFVPIGTAFLLVGGAVFIWQFGSWLMSAADRPVESVNFVLGCLIFGLQSLYFGLLAHLVVQRGGK